jgi:integrase
MKHIQKSIIFRLEQRKKDGVSVTDNVPIRMRVTFEGKRIEFGTGYRIDKSKWDAVHQQVRHGCYNKQGDSYNAINDDLEEYKSIIHGIFREFEVKGTCPTPELVKAAFYRKTIPDFDDKVKVSKAPERSLTQIYMEFMHQMNIQHDWSASTYNRFSRILRQLRQFNERLTLADLNEDGLTKFVEYLANDTELHNITIDHVISCVKMFLRWCYRKGYTEDHAYETFRQKLKIQKRKVIYLTEEELFRLMDYEIPVGKAYLEHVRDVFVFMCFTGLRHSDAYNLHRSNIVNGDHLEITTIKTGSNLTIELTEQSKAILDKYKDCTFPEDRALPIISNQRMNKYLKELAMLVGLNEKVRMITYKGKERIEKDYYKYELISTHCARRTFVTIALSENISPEVVMQWTGHSDYETMKPYIAITNTARANSMIDLGHALEARKCQRNIH